MLAHLDRLPTGVSSAIVRVRRERNAWIALDAASIGVAASVLTGAPIALVLLLTQQALWPTVGLALVAGIAAATRSLYRYRIDALRAALLLDALLDARDRFASALEFVAKDQPSALEMQQVQDAAAYLGRAGAIPRSPRPALRAQRHAAAAGLVLVLSAVVTWNAPWIRAYLWAPEAAGGAKPRSAEEIAAEADALRRALEDSPNRRVDAEINALEHDLETQRDRLRADRARAFAEAAALLEAAMGQPEQSASSNEASTQDPQEPPNALPPTASPRLFEAWSEAEQARERWRDAVTTEGRSAEEIAALHAAAAQAQREAYELAEQERHWTRDSENGATGAGETASAPRAKPSAEELIDAARRLDRAIGLAERTDDSMGVPDGNVGRALDSAAQQLRADAPNTSASLRTAAASRQRGDTAQMDRALEEAREALAREAGMEPRTFADARRRLDALHDQAASRPSEANQSAGEQQSRAPSGSAAGATKNAGASRPGTQGRRAGTGARSGSGASPAAGSGQGPESASAAGSGQGSESASAAGSGEGSESASAASAGSGQGSESASAAGAGSGEGSESASAAGAGSGQGSESGSAAGAGSGQGSTTGAGTTATSASGGAPGTWGTASGGDPIGATTGDSADVSPGVITDPGTDPGKPAELAPDADPMGLLSGMGFGPSSRRAPRYGGIEYIGPRRGDGAIAPLGTGAPRAAAQTSNVPASLRGFVRRYMQSVNAEGKQE